jgi:subtilisin family serine protease
MGRVSRAAASAVVLALVAAAPSQAAERARPTGRWLLVFRRAATARSSATVSAVLARAGARRAGRGVPRLGVTPVRGSAGAIRALRRDPGVEGVSREWYRALRRVPNDPALHTVEDEWGGVSGGSVIQWALQREGFYRAWDFTTGSGARVAVLDTGVDGAHPEFAGKIATSDAVGTSDPLSDPDGHGTHTSGLACAATDNGRGVAGAGWGCKLNVVKLGFSTFGIPDDEIVAAIQIAADRGTTTISMSFGGGGPSVALDRAIDYALSKGIVLVAAASNNSTSDQGAPASQLQPDNASDLNAGRGLVVTAADYFDTRAGTGYGPQVSLAAYGFYDDAPEGPPGLISTYPSDFDPLNHECDSPLFGCRRSLNGDDRYAYLQGTSMATPQVAALAALVADLNPWLGVGDRLKLIKQTARRSGGWSSDLGWGIVNAGAAISAARRIDRNPPSSRARVRRRARVLPGRRRARGRVRWSGSDPAGRSQLIPSGVRSFDLYMRRGHGRYHRVRHASRRHAALLRLRSGVYRFYTRATDAAGNREAPPRHADAKLVVKRARKR